MGLLCRGNKWIYRGNIISILLFSCDRYTHCQTLLFAIDNDNFIQYTQVILLNSFLKKDIKQYRKGTKRDGYFKTLHTMSRIKLNNKLLTQLSTANNLLNQNRHTTREEFSTKVQAWYLAELSREQRKKKIIQTELTERIGKKRVYVTLLERGETYMQLSTFLSISDALGICG